MELNKTLINCKKSKEGFFNFDLTNKVYVNLDLVKWGIRFSFNNLNNTFILKKFPLNKHKSGFYYQIPYVGFYPYIAENQLLREGFFMYLKKNKL